MYIIIGHDLIDGNTLRKAYSERYAGYDYVVVKNADAREDYREKVRNEKYDNFCKKNSTNRLRVDLILYDYVNETLEQKLRALYFGFHKTPEEIAEIFDLNLDFLKSKIKEWEEETT